MKLSKKLKDWTPHIYYAHTSLVLSEKEWKGPIRLTYLLLESQKLDKLPHENTTNVQDDTSQKCTEYLFLRFSQC